MTDDLNCDLGSYGHPLVKTPHIDRLASEGTLFRNAYCNFPQCGQSRASFMTGLYPEQTGVTELRRLFRDYIPDAVTLPQHFMNSGYQVARVGKIYHYDNPKGIGSNGHDDEASWHRRVNPRGIDKKIEDKIFSLKPGRFGGTLSWLAAEGSDEEHTDGIVATESIQLMKEYAKSGEPFFLGVGFYKPHTPYVAPKKYFDRYDLEDIEVPTIPENYLDTIPPSAAKSVSRLKEQWHLEESVAKEAIRAYYATTTFLDAQVGRVLEALDELGLKENTIVLFSSDHGYHLGEHGYYQKRTMFENASRVPLIVSVPWMKRQIAETNAIVEMIDFYKTLSDLAGLEPPRDYVKGRSIRPLLSSSEERVREDALMRHFQGYSLRTEQYRYNLWDSGETELYDHSLDPEEMKNLAGDSRYSELMESLDRRIRLRMEDARRPHPNLKFTPPEPGDKGADMTPYYIVD